MRAYERKQARDGLEEEEKKQTPDLNEDKLLMKFFGSSNKVESFKLGKENAKEFVTHIADVLKDEIIKKLLKVKMPVLKIWFDGRNFTLKLIYRATRDGFNAAKFHSLVDN